MWKYVDTIDICCSSLKYTGALGGGEVKHVDVAVESSKAHFTSERLLSFMSD